MWRKVRVLYTVLMAIFALALVVGGVALFFASDEVTARYIESYLLALAIFVVLFVVGGVIGALSGKSGDGSYYAGDWYDGDSGDGGGSGGD